MGTKEWDLSTGAAGIKEHGTFELYHEPTVNASVAATVTSDSNERSAPARRAEAWLVDVVQAARVDQSISAWQTSDQYSPPRPS